MLENEAKGWHGSFSCVGRNSAEKYHMIIHKDEILSGDVKKKKVVDYFSKVDEQPLPDDVNDDHVDIFLPPTPEEIEKEKQKQKRKRKIFAGERYKYHAAHNRENLKYRAQRKFVEAETQPDCTRYNPKMEFVWKRTITVPCWDISKIVTKPRIPKTRERKPRRTQAVEQNESEKNNSTKGPKTLQINTSFDENSKISPLPTKQMIEQNSMYTFSGRNLTAGTPHSVGIDHDTNRQTVNNITFNKRLSTKTKYVGYQPKTTLRTSGSLINKKKKYDWISYSKGLKAPDFSKTISREKLNYIARDRSPVYPFITPSYAATRPNPLSMVTYSDRTVNKKKGKPFQSTMTNLRFDINKALNKVNNHENPKYVNFDLMMSRPNKDLPMYMMKRVDRNSLYMISDKTLQMNNFKEGKIQTEYSSFYPKKSFNRRINMKMIGSNRFIEDNMNLYGDLANNKLSDFYAKNLDELTNEDVANQFDSITYKTVKQPSLLSEKEKGLFNIDFNEDD